MTEVGVTGGTVEAVGKVSSMGWLTEGMAVGGTEGAATGGSMGNGARKSGEGSGVSKTSWAEGDEWGVFRVWVGELGGGKRLLGQGEGVVSIEGDAS
jgi:hypothetical protein